MFFWKLNQFLENFSQLSYFLLWHPRNLKYIRDTQILYDTDLSNS